MTQLHSLIARICRRKNEIVFEIHLFNDGVNLKSALFPNVLTGTTKKKGIPCSMARGGKHYLMWDTERPRKRELVGMIQQLGKNIVLTIYSEHFHAKVTGYPIFKKRATYDHKQDPESILMMGTKKGRKKSLTRK